MSQRINLSMRCAFAAAACVAIRSSIHIDPQPEQPAVVIITNLLIFYLQG
jgi:hypothetical protein